MVLLGERQFSDKKVLSRQISDKNYNRQISDRKKVTMQISDTIEKEAVYTHTHVYCITLYT